MLKEERIEFVVKDSFDINSLSYPKNISEFNFILNEYIFGYFFGDKRNFEGDPSIMIRNLNTVIPYNGALYRKDLPFLTGMGYNKFLVDKRFLGNSSFIYNNSIFVEVDFEFSKLFSTYVAKEALDDYLLSNISNNYIVYHVNPYHLFLDNLESFNINISNLFHLLDLNDKVEFRFADESFEMPVVRELEIRESTPSTDNLFDYQYNLSKFMKLDLPENFDLTYFEDLRTISLWDSTGNKLIDEYLRTSFLMLTLLSNSINIKIKLLNKHLVAHLSKILDELDVYSNSNHEFKKAISDYRSYINQN